MFQLSTAVVLKLTFNMERRKSHCTFHYNPHLERIKMHYQDIKHKMQNAYLLIATHDILYGCIIILQRCEQNTILTICVNG